MADDPWLGRDPASCAGVDEVGRGCLFGPVFAAAVVLGADAAAALSAQGLTDSKKLSPSRRAALVPRIHQAAQAWALGQASAAEIDRLGIRLATERAMLRALAKLPRPPALLLVDGVLPLRGWPGDQATLVRGDSRNAAIAAASVLAKQARDQLIQALAARFPGYGLERHAGYGTAQHRAALHALGPTALHRRSFLRRLLSAPGTSTRSRPPAAGPPAP
ncbi:ribonuclease HII [Cyanobium sp. NIES-981]|uniref:ribonuclease HII n=1 Tax=Cyanobium sp. NIES-981 TaxID=1851505 RepID=UPI0007DE250E|nr:ribonuclease HII [Cyanobium sp. NIES-981]SBO43610.1 Ribonuclease HII [Cyanobium sp. NIES-981]